jgi:hypothetical protein
MLTNCGFLELIERSAQSGTNPPPISWYTKSLRSISTLIWSGLFTTISAECPENLALGLFYRTDLLYPQR